MKLLIFFLLCASWVYGSVKPDSAWMNQKFSMFIHWGLYSELGGVWDGKPVKQGYSEQIQAHGGIFGDWYASVAGRFLPLAWDADSIVILAQKAGMKSIVFTSKHHDGFCMYHSRYTDYNIVDATPFGRDVMKELAEACRNHGMRFGVYFSLIDWHFPQAYPISSHNADPLTPEHYIFNKKQVEEIMKGYGTISEVWFDMGSLTPEQSRGLYRLVDSLQPSCMISGRLGNDCSDFSVMADNEYPDYKIGVPWQTAASFFEETWGYRSWQERGQVSDKTAEKIESLVKVVSRGGNYLLNIGPKGDGSVVPFEKEVLLSVGRWLEKYGEGIYGAQANPFETNFEWGNVTLKGNALYLFVDKSFIPAVCRLEGLRGTVERVVLPEGEPVGFGKKEGEWEIYLREDLQKESPLSVVRVELAGRFAFEPVHHLVNSGLLTPANAVPVYAYSSMDYYSGYRSMIAYRWGFRSGKRNLRPVLYYTENERGREVVLEVDGEERKIVLENGKLLREEKVGGIKWGKVYRKSSGSVFGSFPRADFPVNLADGWEEVPEFRYGERSETPMRERSSVLWLQEFTADREMELPVEIGSGNGIQVWLNGNCITAHTSPRGNAYRTETVLLPLKRGKNQLLLKLYNRFEKKLCFSFRPLPGLKIYGLEAAAYRLSSKSWHDCRLRAADTPAQNAAMRLNNLRIKL